MRVYIDLLYLYTGQREDLARQVVLATVYFHIENFTIILKQKCENTADSVFFNFRALCRLCNKYHGWRECCLARAILADQYILGVSCCRCRWVSSSDVWRTTGTLPMHCIYICGTAFGRTNITKT